MTIPTVVHRLSAAAVLGACVAVSGSTASAEELSPADALALLSAWLVESRQSIEEGLAALTPAVTAAAAPAVAAWIVASRDDAIARGVEPIPASIRREVAGYVPVDVLDAVRWCVACGGELSLQKGTLRLGIAPAITLDHVIVFADRKDALGDPALWVHELKHVMQFREWGVDGFAARYVADYAAVERDAWEFRWQWVQRTGWLDRRAHWRP